MSQKESDNNHHVGMELFFPVRVPSQSATWSSARFIVKTNILKTSSKAKQNKPIKKTNKKQGTANE